MSRYLAWFVLSLAACNQSPLGVPSSSDGAAPADAAAPADLAVPPSTCLGRAECDCWHRSDCQVIAEACWCPSPQCDPNGACACGGGKYLGCVDVARHCPQISCGLVGSASPDATGCLQCDPAPDCDTARTRLKSACGFSEDYIGALSCTGNPPCIAACLAKLERCDEVTCDYCTTCDCGGQQSWFTACYASCLGG
jgi:hypothetical protein